MRRHRADDNQAEIVMALRQAGARVLSLNQHGHGCPDILVGFRGSLLLMEIKNKRGKGMRLTQDEETFYNEWREYTVVVCDVEEALKAIDAYAA